MKGKRIIKTGIIIFIIGFVFACILAKIGYDYCFRRGGNYDANEQHYPRSTVYFMSAENKLSGYIYGEDNFKGLVVISHGRGASAEAYYSEIQYFVDHGWRVFAYNNTGIHPSEGDSAKGLSQSLFDLQAALDYIAGNTQLSTLPIVLYGHSWGGYAVAAILNYDYPISAVACVAGFDTPQKAIYDYAVCKANIFGAIGVPFFWGYHCIIFGKNSNISAVDGINNTQIPVMIIHGTEDKTLRYDVSGIISCQDKIKNPNAIYKMRDHENQNGHTNLIFAVDADENILSALDEDLFTGINQLFEQAIVK